MIGQLSALKWCTGPGERQYRLVSSVFVDATVLTIILCVCGSVLRRELYILFVLQLNLSCLAYRLLSSIENWSGESIIKTYLLKYCCW